MPVSPEMAEDLAARVRALYDAAEVSLLERLAAALAADLESPAWAELKLAAVGDLRRAVEDVATALQQDANGAVRAALAEAYQRGEQAAVAELGAVPVGREPFIRAQVPNAPAVDRLAASWAQDTRPLYVRITRAIVDAFRDIVARVSGGVLLGAETRRQASQRALDTFARRGITGFVDKAGRSWNLASYAEMAVRSVTARAAIEGHVDTLAAAGEGLVIVSDAPLECPLCSRWEGGILALTGEPGPRTERHEHATEDGRTVVVHVVGTLTEARASGLFHPNCRHSLALYLPGVTTRPPHHPTPGTTYADTQRQREIERHIREWKRRQAAAITPEARRAAGAKVRAWQKAVREHLAAHPVLRRKPERERLPTTDTGMRADPAAMVAASLRTDPDALRAASEQDIADAMASGRLDADDLARVAAEMDRRELQALVDRARAGDLTGWSDDDLARVLPHASGDVAERIAAEFDRRYPPEPLPAPADTGDAVADLLTDWDTLRAVADPAPDPEGWGAYAEADWEPPPDEDQDAERDQDDEEQRPRLTRRQIRELYDDYLYAQYVAAEEDCRGELLTREAEAAGVHPLTLFSGPAHIAFARASEELREWWGTHGRLTLAEFTAQATGVQTAESRRAAENNAARRQIR
ncbi:phage minor capsid protein [Streptomyces sp. URMC 129]|uniref:phage minor capsid protein n=1 Tax=Streptomyces sp. URMC 129 TaxID=3423407 RepID=UPI003F1DCED5